MEPFRPDYSHSILNLSNSLLAHYGLKPFHPTLKLLDEALATEPKTVMLLVFDGLGLANLKQCLSEGDFLLRHNRTALSSVFPPTTTAATTTIESGLSPVEHSWLGWSLHFEEAGKNINLFPNTDETHEQAADYHMARTHLPYVSIFERIAKTRRCKVTTVSPFGDAEVHSFEAMLDTLRNLAQRPDPAFIYGYWYEPDMTMHVKGTTSKQAKAWVRRINDEVEKLASELEDCLLIVTADHGLIESRNRLITDYPDLMDTLKHLPSIEPRALAFHVKDGRQADFEAAFLAHFGSDFRLYPRQELLDQKLFGEGEEHPRFREFIGDYLAVALGEVSLFKTPEEKAKFHGVHAGGTEAEMIVPLILILPGKEGQDATE